MRPARFEQFTLNLIQSTPGVTHAQTLQEAGSTKYPYGLVIATTAGEARWQIVGQLASSEKHDDPDTPVVGPPAQPPGGAADSPEGWLALTLANARCPEIADITRWSTDGARSTQHGVTVRFHNGARTFIRKI